MVTSDLNISPNFIIDHLVLHLYTFSINLIREYFYIFRSLKKMIKCKHHVLFSKYMVSLFY